MVRKTKNTRTKHTHSKTGNGMRKNERPDETSGAGTIPIRIPKNIPEIAYAKTLGQKRELARFLDDMQDEMDNRYSNIWLPATAFVEVKSPNMDVINNDGEYIVHADLPGIPKERIEINVTSSRIEISGTPTIRKGDDSDYLRRERKTSQYYRVMQLPEAILPDKTRASMRDGVLEVHLPKKTPANIRKRQSTISV